MKPTVPDEYISLALNSQVAVLRHHNVVSVLHFDRTRSARHGPAGSSLSCSSRWQQSRSSLEACSSSDTRPGQPMPSTPTHRPLPRTSSRLSPSKALQRLSADEATKPRARRRSPKRRRLPTQPITLQSTTTGATPPSRSVFLSLCNQRPQERLRRVAPYSFMDPNLDKPDSSLPR